MKIAIIDLGTNTFNLLIRDTEGDRLLYNDKLAVKLGEGGINRNEITPAAFERGLEALHRHKKTINDFEVQKTYAFATSAIRGASNGRDFVQAVMETTGIRINVIDGQKEADLIYEGVKNAIDLGDGISLIMDIGGGSTEFILANNHSVFWKNSYNIGSSRLLEIFHPSDPIRKEEVEAIENYLGEQLQDLFEAARPYASIALVGSSGSFDTLAAMIAASYPGEPDPAGLTSYVFDLSKYYTIAQKMITSDIHERLRTPGMIPMRADMIVMSCVQLNFVLQKLGITALKLSTYALKEGIYYSLKSNEEPWQVSLL